jgi:hypothetical protein
VSTSHATQRHRFVGHRVSGGGARRALRPDVSEEARHEVRGSRLTTVHHKPLIKLCHHRATTFSESRQQRGLYMREASVMKTVRTRQLSCGMTRSLFIFDLTLVSITNTIIIIEFADHFQALPLITN